MGRLSLGHEPTRWLAARSLVSNNGLPTVRHLAFSQLLDTHKINVVTRSQVFMGGAGTILLAVSGIWIHCSHFHKSQNMLTAQKPCLGILFLRHRSGDTIQGMAKSWVFSKSFFPWQLKFYWMLSFILEDTFTPKDCLDLLDAFIPGKDNDCCVKDCQWYGTEVGTSFLGQRQPWRELLWCSLLRTTRTFPRTSVETPPG